MTDPAAVSADAEASCHLIRQTLAGHREVIAALTAAAGLGSRLSSSRARPQLPRRGLIGPAASRSQLQRQGTLVRFLAITESFCVERLFEEMLGIVNPSGPPSGVAIWNSTFDSATGNWSNLSAAYKNWLGVNKGVWLPLLELADARNAVAHGHGQLTYRQRRKDRSQLAATLKRHRISLAGDQVFLSEESIDAAAATCSQFIEQLDRELLTQKKP